jgi:CheY-like chemotaxis protein
MGRHGKKNRHQQFLRVIREARRRRNMSKACDILLIEDDPNDVAFMKLALQKAESKAFLEVLTDGESALTYLSARKDNPSELPSLILTDLKLPKRNGHELVEWMRAQPNLAQVPIVVLSSSSMQSDIDRAIHLGANAFITKPLGLTDLEKIVRSLLASWLSQSPK